MKSLTPPAGATAQSPEPQAALGSTGWKLQWAYANPQSKADPLLLAYVSQRTLACSTLFLRHWVTLQTLSPSLELTTLLPNQSGLLEMWRVLLGSQAPRPLA